ncbi:FAD-dependent oxidoreductase [Arthrobacter sp. StoSoilB5]|uniref:NAD(P)/FAD-dependent oxidoreductase n=1 Tax=Arthrobacter sp. StoSoilB5 TaxID=2830992 RepID=UPI001CC6562C|nr:FAD-dependent oxidoreductase [Arthrobacter sp. StoSoilB5]BCW45010.1 oxidoreductase [Arthrobacter sp. StoSoilB5]
MISYDRAEAAATAANIDEALATAAPLPYWLDHPDRPDALPHLSADTSADLAIVGGGYTGLWTALLAKERDPGRRVVLLEGQRIGWAASGRNGGFCEPSLTHGAANGQRHLPGEVQLLDRLGRENMREIQETVRRYGIDCDLEVTGVLKVATEQHQVPWLLDSADGERTEYFDRAAIAEEIASPLYHAGLWKRDGALMVHPAKLAWGMRRVCLDLGVEIYEHTTVERLEPKDDTVLVNTPSATVRASKVALATNVFQPLLKRARPFTVPVYDYALMTEPLTEEQMDAVGWRNRQGVTDLNNRFHYYRITRDLEGRNRILFGGYDAIYNFGGRMKPEYEQNAETSRKLAAHFFATFPQLADVKFSHQWGGAIDTCSRFFSFFTTAYSGRVVHSAGYTGLGVAATRFGARVMLDLLSGEKTHLTELQLVKKKPIPFPPEPIAWLGVRLMTAAMVKADRNRGKRGPFLRVMDAIGMGFDS